MDGWVDGREEEQERGQGQAESCLGISGLTGEPALTGHCSPPSLLLTAATRLFSVMKVRASSGSVSEARVATLSEREISATGAPHTLCLGCPPLMTCTHAIFLLASARHTVLS